jgi:hypothetical protein
MDRVCLVEGAHEHWAVRCQEDSQEGPMWVLGILGGTWAVDSLVRRLEFHLDVSDGYRLLV